MTDKIKWGTPVEIERRNRIRLSLAALQYELYPNDASYMPDGEFDSAARAIDRSIDTGHPVMDAFFSSEAFDPYTGQWVHSHPELDKLKALHARIKQYEAAEVAGGR